MFISLSVSDFPALFSQKGLPASGNIILAFPYYFAYFKSYLFGVNVFLNIPQLTKQESQNELLGLSSPFKACWVG